MPASGVVAAGNWEIFKSAIYSLHKDVIAIFLNKVRPRFCQQVIYCQAVVYGAGKERGDAAQPNGHSISEGNPETHRMFTGLQ